MIISQKEAEELHKPVLLQEVIEALEVKRLARLKKAKFIDATLGLGGHTIEIIKEGGFVLGIDADERTLKLAEERIKEACPTLESGSFQGAFKAVNANFKDIDQIAETQGFLDADGILFDLGVSSYQLTDQERGFSFQNPAAELDMRIDRTGQAVTASDLINALPEKSLKSLFVQVMNSRDALVLSAGIVKQRKVKRIETVGDLNEIVNITIADKKKINRSTLPFLALRIAVNSELENLKDGLTKAFAVLADGGKMVVISFHSAEDRLVKEFYNQLEKNGSGVKENSHPIVPADGEIKVNPRARSAKLRIIRKKS